MWQLKDQRLQVVDSQYVSEGYFCLRSYELRSFPFYVWLLDTNLRLNFSFRCRYCRPKEYSLLSGRHQDATKAILWCPF